MLKTILILCFAYLLGSIPFGVLIAKFKKIDIQTSGSGNIGATNVLRSVGLIPGILVFILDLLKGTAATYLAVLYLKEPLLIISVGFAAILGHLFPIFLRFKGGKGSAVGLGVLLAIAPDVFLISFILVALLIALTRYVSIASIFGSVTTVIIMFIFNKPLPYSIVTLFATCLIIYKHIPNIKRLLAGTEPKIKGKPHV